MLIVIDRQDGSELQTYSLEWKGGLAIEEAIGELGYLQVYFAQDEIDTLIQNLLEEKVMLDSRLLTTDAPEMTVGDSDPVSKHYTDERVCEYCEEEAAKCVGVCDSCYELIFGRKRSENTVK
jgi:hypothetical protein